MYPPFSAGIHPWPKLGLPQKPAVLTTGSGRPRPFPVSKFAIHQPGEGTSTSPEVSPHKNRSPEMPCLLPSLIQLPIFALQDLHDLLVHFLVGRELLSQLVCLHFRPLRRVARWFRRRLARRMRWPRHLNRVINVHRRPRRAGNQVVRPVFSAGPGEPTPPLAGSASSQASNHRSRIGVFSAPTSEPFGSQMVRRYP